MPSQEFQNLATKMSPLEDLLTAAFKKIRPASEEDVKKQNEEQHLKRLLDEGFPWKIESQPRPDTTIGEELKEQVQYDANFPVRRKRKRRRGRSLTVRENTNQQRPKRAELFIYPKTLKDVFEIFLAVVLYYLMYSIFKAI